ncbi:MAG: peptidase M48 [Spirochaetae bacterium HGW-Spirochaetae-3]|jgi:STE24 endopeptidase|nr:MAG: peptidase M48 [Spirochaetae bacterium HGW-Spirochaetae-3]
MSSSTIIAIYIALAAADLGWGILLGLLNRRSVLASQARVPPELAGSVSPEEAEKSRSYTLARMRLSFVQEPVTTAIVVAVAAAGIFGLLDDIVRGLVEGEYWRGALFLGAVAVASGLLSLPFSIYSTFVLEKRFGFNTTTIRTWLVDGLKGSVIATVLGLPLLWLLFVFMNATGSLWWLWAATIFSALSVVLSLLYPLVIAPLFNTFTPLPDGSLAERIRAMAERTGFRMSGVFVMDGSKRSRHSNAYFTGLGKAKRIVLYDTLVDSMDEDEILAVLGHEIGHEKKRHIVKGTVLSIGLSFATFYALSLLARWPELYAAFGFARDGAAYPTKEALLLVFGLVSGPATFFLAPIFSAWSRAHEYEADRFAVEAMDSYPAGVAALSSALIRLNKENASNLWPHPLYSFWYYSHPTLLERLRAIQGDREEGRTALFI